MKQKLLSLEFVKEEFDRRALKRTGINKVLSSRFSPEVNEKFDEDVKKLLNKHFKKRLSNVLEIGVGIGRLAEHFSKISDRYVGVDFSKEMLAHASNSLRHKKNVELIWITETEINNDYFTIERSTDLKRWEVVKKINGAGNSNTPLHYITVDENPYKGISYYRLKQTDFNGVFTYSKVVIIDNKELDDILVYPNPVKDVLTIKTTCDNCNIKIYSALGQLVYNGNEKKINTSNWAKGVYEVVIINNSGSFFNTKVFK